MSVVISLCHFCEVHGPSILLCTQACNYADLPLLPGYLDAASAENMFPQESFQDAKQTDPSSSRYPLGISGSVAGHPILFPVGEGEGTDSDTSYEKEEVAGRSRSNSERAATASAARKARSDDKVPGSNGTCKACKVFREEQRGFVTTDSGKHISYITFQHPQNDTMYSIVKNACVRSLSSEVCQGREGPFFFGDDQQGYVFSHTFHIPDCHSRGFQRWYSILTWARDKIFLVSSWLFLVESCRAVIEQLQGKAQVVFDKDVAEKTARSFRLKSSTYSTGGRCQRGSSGRSLAELCNCKDLFQSLHRYFTWMLKASSTRVQEALPHLIEAGRLQEAAKDKKEDDDDVDDEEELMKDESKTDETALPVVVETGPMFESLKHIYRLLGPVRFHQLASHVVRGSQVIVRSNSKLTNSSAFEILSGLLPPGCCNVIAYSSTYLDSFRCNFLGLSLDSSLPDHLYGSEVFVLLDIIPSQQVPTMTQPRQGQPSVVSCEVVGDAFNGFGFVVRCGGSGQDSRKPLLLRRIEAIISDESLDDAAVMRCIDVLKEEWMSKVKMAFKFSRRAAHENTPLDRPRLLQVLQVGPEELPVLQFWLRGLSPEQRSMLLRL